MDLFRKYKLRKILKELTIMGSPNGVFITLENGFDNDLKITKQMTTDLKRSRLPNVLNNLCIMDAMLRTRILG